MRVFEKLRVVVAVFGMVAAAFAQKPLAVKSGQWEITHSMQTSGALALPPDVLAKMSPEQRARMEAAMKAHNAGGGKPHVSRSCVTKEDLAKPFGKDKDDDSCKWNLTSSTGTRQEANIQCTEDGVTRTGTVLIEALSPESVKMNMHMTSSNGSDKGSVDMQMTAKWVGPVCSAKDED
jgi:hypothetical protein